MHICAGTGGMLMASCLTDDEREVRYIGLRKKKRISDILCAIPFFPGAVIIIMAALSLPGAVGDEMVGNGWGGVVQCLCMAASAVITVYAAYTRRVKYILAGALAVAVLELIGQAGVSLVLIPILIPAVFGAILWSKLEEEEGFPLFRIPYEEISERRKATEQKIRYRAVEAGTRRLTEPQAAADDMGDLLDEQADTPVLTSALHNYHDRARNAQGELSAPMNDAGAYGEMDEL